ncbi:hypothetical protein MHYP_G00049830 [Metynnis hypsauchen]
MLIPQVSYGGLGLGIGKAIVLEDPITAQFKLPGWKFKTQCSGQVLRGTEKTRGPGRDPNRIRWRARTFEEKDTDKEIQTYHVHPHTFL